ncbi:protein-tyrosine-phosphatase [bacterium E08(2017)]|nr:protein-tyrosine-phosphatase [bacterium E08(2017)]
MNTALKQYISESLTEIDSLPAERKELLNELAAFIKEELSAGNPVALIFICTHNSRRSHLSQVWAQTAAAHFGIDNIRTYSGGTEATAFHPNAVAALQRAGFEIEKTTDDANPLYQVHIDDNEEPMTCFSKVYDDDPNPTQDYCAVMTCSSADAGCPVVVGCKKRIAVLYDDPKKFDGTDRESEAYDERCRQISVEQLFIFSQVA